MGEGLRVRCLATTWDVVGAEGALREELERTWSRALVAQALPADVADGGLDDLRDAEGEPTPEQRAGIVGPHPYELADEGVQLERPMESTRLLGDGQDAYRVVSGLVMASIGRLAGRRLMLHAAGISDEQGRVAALVAESGTGKTTASRRLTQGRFGYVTDECVAVASDQSVLYFPKPLSFVRDPQEPRVKDQLGPDELGLVEPPAELALRRIVLLSRLREGEDDPAGPGAQVPRLEPVDLLSAVAALVPQTSAMPRMEDPLHRLAGAVLQCGGGWRLVYREIDSTPALLAELLEAAPEPRPLAQAMEEAGVESHRPAPDRRLGGGVVPPVAAPEQIPAGARLRRGRYTDAIGEGLALVVMRGTSVLQLDGIGAQVWFDCDQPRTVPELLDLAREVFGDHPDAPALMDAAVRSLLDEGLLTLEEAPEQG